ncbi:MAG: hypothetical protein BWZ00_01624 [Bacteroidetes bacterium ADurb.BinA174]|nr:MAG: hypothetical protein BWZ00_01624 [Bacteroidetes bacterium ADurb.BinA174]
MAFSPKGVAALSNPSILAETFIKMEPDAGCPLGISGKSLENNGATLRENISIIPPRSPIFITPNQSERTPVKPKEISKPVLAESYVEFIISVNIYTSPKKMSLAKATTKAMIKKAIQM